MAKVPLGKLARAIRQVSSGMGSSGWLCSDIVILLQVFMKHFLMVFCFYSTLFSFPCPLVQTKFPSRVIYRAHRPDDFVHLLDWVLHVGITCGASIFSPTTNWSN